MIETVSPGDSPIPFVDVHSSQLAKTIFGETLSLGFPAKACCAGRAGKTSGDLSCEPPLAFGIISYHVPGNAVITRTSGTRQTSGDGLPRANVQTASETSCQPRRHR